MNVIQHTHTYIQVCMYVINVYVYMLQYASNEYIRVTLYECMLKVYAMYTVLY